MRTKRELQREIEICGCFEQTILYDIDMLVAKRASMTKWIRSRRKELDRWRERMYAADRELSMFD